MSKKLDTFVDDWNDDCLQTDYYSPGYGALVDESFSRNFQLSEASQSPGLRVSSLGSYGIVQAIKVVSWNQYRRSLKEKATIGRKADIFHTGDVIEARLLAVMEGSGFEVKHKQEAIVWNGVTGHPDGMVENTVFDVKTSSSGNFKRYMKNPPLSYVTQLAVYADALNASFAALLFYDKDNCQLGIKYLDYDVMQAARERAAGIIEGVNSCITIKDVYDVFDVPEPLEEVFQKRGTGKYYAPYDLYAPFPDLLYERVADKSGYGNEREYIVGIRSHEDVAMLIR